MKTKIIAAASITAVAVAVIAAIVVANPFGTSETAMMGGGEESMHTEGMAPLGVNDGEESMHKEGMAPLGAESGEESMHGDGMAPLTANVEIEARIIAPDADGRTVSATRAKPYIGVAISETEQGAVKVMEVLEHGPSNGVLETGDLITAVAGEPIAGAEDLTEAIADAGAGASLALTVERDGGASEISVNVGEFIQDAASGISRYNYSQTFDLPKDGFPMMMDRNILDQFGKDEFSDFPMMMDKDMFGEMGEFSDFPMMTMDKDMFGGMGDFGMSAWGANDGVARMEKSMAGEDGGYQTHRMASGTVTEVDADAGTFTLQPKDGSEAITYSVTDGTKTVISGSGTIGGLSADGETPTFVMDVDGVAELVQQGEGAP